MFVRNTIFKATFALWTLLFAPLIPLLWVAGTPAALIRHLTRLWARGVLALSSLLGGIRFTVRGRANVPDGPTLIVANHQSAWETIAALVLFPDVAIVTKQELLAIPVIGWFLRHSPMILIDRDGSTSAMRKMLADCRRAVADGRSILIFPEGTRKPPGNRVEFKRGVELLYRSLDISALVVAHDAGRVWHDNICLSPGEINVSIHPPIAPGSPALQFTKTAEAALNEAVTGLAQQMA